MNFDSYSDCSVAMAVDLVNSDGGVNGDEELGSVKALRSFLDAHDCSYRRQPSASDLDGIRRLRGRLREVFSTPSEERAVAILNALLAESRALPQLTDHDGEPLHLHFSPPDAPLPQKLAAEAAMGLAIVIRDHGFDRLRLCSADDCADAFVDSSRNRSRRYCNPHLCGNRAHVAAYRARQRADEPAGVA